MQQSTKLNYQKRSEQPPPLPPPRPQSEFTLEDLQLRTRHMQENPSPRQSPLRTSALQVLPSAADNQLLHTSTQQQRNEQMSDVSADEDFATCDDEDYYSSISESASYSNTTPLSQNFLQIVTNRMRQVRLAMLKLNIMSNCLCLRENQMVKS